MRRGQVGRLWLASLNEEGADFLANPNPLGAKPNGMNGKWMGKDGQQCCRQAKKDFLANQLMALPSPWLICCCCCWMSERERKGVGKPTSTPLLVDVHPDSPPAAAAAVDSLASRKLAAL